MSTIPKSPKRLIAEFVGWYGTTAIVLAYILVSFDVIASSSYIFQLLNLTGASGIIIISAIKGVGQSVILNIFWAIIATAALIQLFIK